MKLNKNMGKYKIFSKISKCYQFNMNVNAVNEIMYLILVFTKFNKKDGQAFRT